MIKLKFRGLLNCEMKEIRPSKAKEASYKRRNRNPPEVSELAELVEELLAALLRNCSRAVPELLRNCFGTVADMLWNCCRAVAELLQNYCRTVAELLRKWFGTVGGYTFLRTGVAVGNTS